MIAPIALAQRVATGLIAPTPSWRLTTDVVIAGSGVAGLALAHALSAGGVQVDLITKARLRDGSTRWAQGGVAAAGEGDDVEHHLADTLVAGAGLCDPEAVRILVTEGPAAVEAIRAAGARFDREPDGTLSRTLEGGHSRARILHAGGDATGLEIQRTLEEVARAGTVRIHERTFLLDLLRDGSGTVTGCLVADLDETGNCRSVGTIEARATVLATGGLGQAFARTTNPAVATGDGLAAALRAGAEVADVEFVQFHPTVLDSDPAGDGRALLISEAVRGEGAVIVDATGTSVMDGVHPLSDLAPRDVVATRMAQWMAVTDVDRLFLDARHLGEPLLLRRFPTIVAGCRRLGVDPVREPIPVVPAAHYSCGGVRADLSGRTSLAGLFALGEVACTGVHGANRLASNSLLESLVSARRLGALLADELPTRRRAAASPRGDGQVEPADRRTLARAMARDAGVLREPGGLDALAVQLDDALDRSDRSSLSVWEATNLHTVSTALVAAARLRAESRGCHRRTDLDHPVDDWRHHIVSTVSQGSLVPELRSRSA